MRSTPSRYSTPPGHNRRRRRLPAPMLVAFALVAVAFVVVAGLRFVPGSPLAASAADDGVQSTPRPSGSATPRPGVEEDAAAAGDPLPPLAVRPAAVRVNRTG